MKVEQPQPIRRKRPVRFTFKMVQEFRKRYDAGMSSIRIGKEANVSSLGVRKAIQRAGGKIRSIAEAGKLRAKRYHWNSSREKVLWCSYRLTFNDVLFLFRRQKGLCLWCRKPLPLENILMCCIDHVGGKKTWRNRSTIRGLCCPDNACNGLAGYIEADLNKAKRIIRVLQTCSFPFA